MKTGRLDHQVDIHDHTQLEIRLDYDQDLSKKKNCYHIETFLFFPKSLRIDKQHYYKDHFYQDLKTNIRLKTPPVALTKLVDSDNPSSLKHRIAEPFNRLLSGQGSDSDISNIIYELKVFGTIFRGQVSDQTENLVAQIAQINGDVKKYATICDDIQKLIKLFVKDITHTVEVFRKLRSKFSRPTIPDKINLVLEEINEFISLVIDTNLSRLALDINQVNELSSTISPAYDKLIHLLQKEAEYREGAGYLSGNPLLHDGEKYIYRKGELKKTIMEVLFLRPKLQPEGDKTSQFIAMIAAGLAMSWAAISMLLGHTTLVINSMPFLFLMVFSYIVKDRIKDMIKSKLNQKILSKFFYDHRIEFFSHKTEKAMGHVRERFDFVDKEQLPDDVILARYPSNLGKRFETIIRHERVVTLFTKEFEKLYSRITNVTRVSIASYLNKMDDASTLMPCYVHEINSVKSIKMSKVYHIHLVLKMSPCCKDKKPILKHYRIIINKEGIKRLETLTADSQVETVRYYPILTPADIHIEPEEFGREIEVPLAHTKVVEEHDESKLSGLQSNDAPTSS